MSKPTAVLFLLVTLAVLGLLDRDGILARTEVAARALGLELRIDVTVRNMAHGPVVPVVPVAAVAPSPARTCPHEALPCE